MKESITQYQSPTLRIIIHGRILTQNNTQEDEGIDYEIIRLSAQPNYSWSDSYPKKQAGKPIEEDRMLTMQAAIGLCMVSQSKGGKHVRGMMLNILDLFKAGIRDPSNKIFDAITHFF